MLVKLRLWIARLLKRIANRLGKNPYSLLEIKNICEAMFFSGYFPLEIYPEGPPPSLKTTKNLYRSRTLKGNVGRTAIVRKDNINSSDILEIWVEDGPSPIRPNRKDWGDPNNTTERLIERGVLKDYKDDKYLKVTKIKPKNEKAI